MGRYNGKPNQTMSIRTTIANQLIGVGRKLGRNPGESELKVSVSDHDIKVKMVDTDKQDHAWDHDLYKSGGIFYRGHANPLKIRLNQKEGMAEKDTVELEESEQDDSDNNTHVEVMSSNRYRKFMYQSLIQDLVNPTENWKKLVYGLIGVGVLQFLTIIVVLVSTGSFG